MKKAILGSTIACLISIGSVSLGWTAESLQDLLPQAKDAAELLQAMDTLNKIATGAPMPPGEIGPQSGQQADAQAATADPSLVPPGPPSFEAPPPVQNSFGETLYSFRAENLDIKQALALFARANHLNIVPDLDLAGWITIDVHTLPLETILAALLDAHGFFWEDRNGLIRVHSAETRIFTINYPRMVRSGDGYSSVSLSGSSGGGAQGGGGGGGAGGGGSSGGGGGGGGAGGAGGAGAAAGSGTSITQQDNIDFWKELEAQLTLMLNPRGKVVVDKMSGVVQVTDAPSAIERIAHFLELMQTRTHRQVDIETRIYEVTLNNEFQLGVDWKAVLANPEIAGVIAASTIVNLPIGGVVPSAPAIAGTLTKRESDFEISAIIRALDEQGHVEAISQPRLRSLNNQMAVIKVGTEQPFFNTNSGFIAGNGGSPGGTFENSTVESITVGTILSITPQISDDGHITLDISPVISSLVGIESAGDQGLTTAPVLDIKQSSSLIRVKSGETIIIGGLIQDKSAQTSRRVPVLGNIPVVGLPFRGEFRADRKTELVIFMTPTVIEDLPPGFVTPPSNANAWPQPGAVAEASPQPVMPESDKNPLPTRNTRKGFLGSRNNHGSRNR